MYISRLTHIACLLFFIGPFIVNAQEASRLSAGEINEYIEESRQLVKYLEGTLNFLGDPAQVPSEKDIIINQSYLKMFQSEETQVEDDLDPNREMALNKDVQAYLKDVDFFFKEVVFNFDISDVEQLVNENGQVYFKVTMSRNLNGVSVNGDTLNNNQVRYIEINLDQVQKDLKIASMYTTTPDPRQELNYWWVQMSDNWKGFLGDSIFLYPTRFDTVGDTVMAVRDTVPFSRILAFNDSSFVTDRWLEDYRFDSFMVYRDDTLRFANLADSIYYLGDTLIDSTIHYLRVYDTLDTDGEFIYRTLEGFAAMKKLDISGNLSLTDLKPLSMLTDLIFIDFSSTKISDLSPLRNLNKLESIICSGSNVATLEPLRYSTNLKEINCSKTQVTDIAVLLYLKNLNTLNMSGLAVTDLTPLENLQNLTHLNLSGVDVNDISVLEGLEDLTDLNISRTSVTSLASVGKISNLKSLNIDSTYITRLDPLRNLQNLSNVQANSSRISILDPLSGMESLKLIYCDNTGIDGSKASAFMDANQGCLVIYNTRKLEQWWEELPAEYKAIIHERRVISDPITKEQLHEIISLTRVDLSNQESITDIKPLGMLHRLEILNLENTPVTDISPLADLHNLKELNLNGTQVNDISPLRALRNLTQIAFENTDVNELRSLLSNPYLKKISGDGSKIDQQDVILFRDSLPECLVIFQSESLLAWWNDLGENWKKVMQDQMTMEQPPGVESLQRLVNLESVNINDNPQVNDLEPLQEFVFLRKLTASNTRINDIGPLLELPYLEELNLPNNPITSLPGITKLKTLRQLNLENTALDDLESIGQMSWVTTLNLAGTPVKKLKDLSGMTSLEVLMINNTEVKKLKGIEALPNLKELKCYRTGISEKNIQEYREEHPGIDVTYY